MYNDITYDIIIFIKYLAAIILYIENMPSVIDNLRQYSQNLIMIIPVFIDEKLK